ncbi:MAG: DUF4293 family protein [Flavobacteriales bacterium]|nr:DUF4293 family protein [Flavobacteriales bacterium]
MALAAAVLLLFAFPLVQYHRADQQHFNMALTSLQLTDGTPVQDADYKLPVAVLAVVLAGLWLVAVFLYRNRPRQVRMVRYGYLLAATLFASMWITHSSVAAYIGREAQLDFALQPAFFLPLLAVALAFLADRAIRKDEALVRSADRLR